MKKEPKKEPQDLKVFSIAEISTGDLKKWQEFLLPEEKRELSREQLEDIYAAYVEEIGLLKDYLAGRQAESKRPDRMYSRILIQLGETTDQAINQLIKNNEQSTDSNSDS